LTNTQFTSDHAKTFSKITGKPLTTLFFQEAKKLLELEGVKASLPTVQALEMMFTKSAYIGTDRAGMLYRSAALEMLKRLNLERRFELIQDSTPSAFREKRAISKAVWGFFNFERYSMDSRLSLESCKADYYLLYKTVSAPISTYHHPLFTLLKFLAYSMTLEKKATRLGVEMWICLVGHSPMNLLNLQ